MRIKRTLTLTLCAILITAACVFAAPAGAKAETIVFYVGNEKISAENIGDVVYKKYSDSVTPGLSDGTSADFNIAVKYESNDKVVVTLNNLTITRMGDWNSRYFSLGSTKDVDFILLGQNSVAAVGPTVNRSWGIFADQDCSFSGTGRLQVTGGSSTDTSVGIYAGGALSISGGEIIVTGGSSQDPSYGVGAIGGVIMTGGDLTAIGANSAIVNAFQLGVKRWYKWKSGTSMTEPGGGFTNSVVDLYNYQDTDKYIHIRSTVTISPSKLDFGSMSEGDNLPEAQPFTVTNNSATTVTLSPPAQSNYTFPSLPASVGVGDTATFTVQPKDSLTADRYLETVTLSTNPCSLQLALDFTVNPVAPSITDQPDDVMAAEGKTASFSVTATGSAPLRYQWQMSTDSGASWTNTGENSSTYSFTTDNRMNGRQYRCIVSNAANQSGVTSNVATLTVLSQRARIGLTPPGQTLYTDTSITLAVSSEDMFEPKTYKWWQNDVDSEVGASRISGANHHNYVFTPGTVSKLYYFCTVSDAYGTATSNIVEIDAKAHLTFTDSDAFNVPAGMAGADITPIDVSSGVADGVGSYAYSLENSPSWLSIDAATGVISGTRPTTGQAQTTATVKVTDSATPAESCTITIDVGAVAARPAITVQPRNQSVLVGQTATFSLTATGTGLTYQWQIDRNDGRGWQPVGTNSPGYTTAKVKLADNGYRYRCVVSDQHGYRLESDPATLRVTKPTVPPKTGDGGQPMMWLALCALCGLMVGMLTRAGKRRRA